MYLIPFFFKWNNHKVFKLKGSCPNVGWPRAVGLKWMRLGLLWAVNKVRSAKQLRILRSWQEDEWEELRNTTQHHSPGGESPVMWDVLLPAQHLTHLLRDHKESAAPEKHLITGLKNDWGGSNGLNGDAVKHFVTKCFLGAISHTKGKCCSNRSLNVHPADPCVL